MHWAKQSTAVSYVVGPIFDSTGAEYASAVIGDLSLSKNGGTLTALASAATLTYIANGLYTLAMTTGNTDTLGTARVFCNKSTYQMPPLALMVLPATVYDALTANATNAAGGFAAATGAISALAGAVSTLTQTQVTGGAYALNSSSFAFNAALDFTTTQKAATLARVTLADTLTTYTGNTPQTGDSFARIGATGSGLTSLAPSGTALSTAQWSNTRAGYLDNLSGGAVALASGVTLADGVTHGGSTAVLSLERMAVTSTTTNEPAVKLTGNGTAAGLLVQADGTAAAAGAKFVGGIGSTAYGLHVVGGQAAPGAFFTGGSGGGGHGIQATGTGTGKAGMFLTGGASAGGLQLQGGSTAPGLRSTGGTSGNGVEFTAGAGGTGAVFAGNAAGSGATFTGGASGSDVVLTNSASVTFAAAVWTGGTRTLTAAALASGSIATAADVSAVPTQITTDHGSGSYVRNTEPVDVSTNVAAIKAKTDNLPAAPAAVGDVPTAAANASAVWSAGTRTLTSAGSGGATAQEVWEYATRTLTSVTGVTLADNAITSAKIADNAITDAKLAVPAEAIGRPTTVLGMLRRLWERMTNKRTRNRSTGVFTLYGADDTTAIETSTQGTTGAVDSQTKGA